MRATISLEFEPWFQPLFIVDKRKKPPCISKRGISTTRIDYAFNGDKTAPEQYLVTSQRFTFGRNLFIWRKLQAIKNLTCCLKNEIVGRHFTVAAARALTQLVDFHTIWNYKAGELPAEMLLGLFGIMHTLLTKANLG